MLTKKRTLFFIFSFVCFLFLTACATTTSIDEKYGISLVPSQKQHPVIQSFLLAYDQAKQQKDLQVFIGNHYVEISIDRHGRSSGWAKYLYESIYMAFINGDCENLWFDNLTNKSVEVYCTGAYRLSVYDQDMLRERMFLQAKLMPDNRTGSWKFIRGGLYVTQFSGRANPLRYGERLSSELVQKYLSP